MPHRRTVRHLTRRALPAVLLGALALAAAACGSGSTEKAAEAASPFTEVSAGTIKADDAIPALTGEETILTLKGGATTNATLDREFELQVDLLAEELAGLLCEQRARLFLTDEEQHLLSVAAGELLQLYLAPDPVPTWRPD